MFCNLICYYPLALLPSCPLALLPSCPLALLPSCKRGYQLQINKKTSSLALIYGDLSFFF
ncbi:hypothetical protein F0261_08100 [Alteromonas sp. 07-89-2]|nr:hypothetical protein [Alteromonas sp. 07-89-2]